MAHVTYTRWTMSAYLKTPCMMSYWCTSTDLRSRLVPQGCLRERHEIDRHKPKHLVIARRRLRQWLEICGGKREWREVSMRGARRKERQQNQAPSSKPTVKLCVRQFWLSLPCKGRASQSHLSLLSTRRVRPKLHRAQISVS